MEKDFIEDFITVKELREILSELRDNDLITVTKGNTHCNHRITHVEDSTSIGFYELRIK